MDYIKASRETLETDLFTKTSVMSVRDPHGRGFSHAKWMLEEIMKDEMSVGKANRWLGYAQGLLVCSGALTLETMKEINKNCI